VSALVVAIEGIDGSGKGTQAVMLRDALERGGRSCGLIAFPRYQVTTFGRTIARYLNGEFGDLAAAGPHFAALLYAGDRFESLPLIQSEIASRDVLLFDRYVASNLAHQAAKLPPSEREPFIAWVESIEFGVYSLPCAHLTIYLEMPVATARELIAKKPSRVYTTKPADLHEADADYLERTAEVYRDLAARDASWTCVPCCSAGQLRTAESVHADIRRLVEQTIEHRRVSH
jgi:dTMP kinase